MSFPCPLCDHTFSRKGKLEDHLNRAKPCVEKPTGEQTKALNEIINKYNLKVNQTYPCDGCTAIFHRKDTLSYHKKTGTCPNDKVNNQSSSTTIITASGNNVSAQGKDEQMRALESLQQQMKYIQDSVNLLMKQNYLTNRNDLNVVYIDPIDNLLKKMMRIMGHSSAINFIRNSALTISHIGDALILNKVYMTAEDGYDITIPPVRFIDSDCTKVEYMSRTNGHKIESLTSFMDMLSILLRACYSETKSILNDMANRGRTDANLDLYEIEIWSKHQSNLTDDKYKKKLSKHLTLIAGSKANRN